MTSIILENLINEYKNSMLPDPQYNPNSDFDISDEGFQKMLRDYLEVISCLLSDDVNSVTEKLRKHLEERYE